MAERPTKHGWTLYLFVVAIVLFMLYMYSIFSSGIAVSVVNTGTKMRSVVLHVTGKSYPVGDILPGKTIVAVVQPTNESHLEIEFADAQGQKQRLKVDVYFEPGYRGTVSVVIKDSTVESSEYRESGIW